MSLNHSWRAWTGLTLLSVAAGFLVTSPTEAQQPPPAVPNPVKNLKPGNNNQNSTNPSSSSSSSKSATGNQTKSAVVPAPASSGTSTSLAPSVTVRPLTPAVVVYPYGGNQGQVPLFAGNGQVYYGQNYPLGVYGQYGYNPGNPYGNGYPFNPYPPNGGLYPANYPYANPFATPGLYGPNNPYVYANGGFGNYPMVNGNPWLGNYPQNGQFGANNLYFPQAGMPYGAYPYAPGNMYYPPPDLSGVGGQFGYRPPVYPSNVLFGNWGSYLGPNLGYRGPGY